MEEKALCCRSYLSRDEIRQAIRVIAYKTLVLILAATGAATVFNFARPNGIPWSLSFDLNQFPNLRVHVDLPRVSLEEMHQRWQAGEILPIDARNADDFIHGHIPGAINIPAADAREEFAQISAFLEHNGTLVIYCSGPTCDLSDQLAKVMLAAGYSGMSIFPGGLEEWTTAGYPVDHGGEG